MIKGVNNILKHFLDQDIVSESDSFDDETDSDFSSVEGKGLKMLTSNQTLSRLPITLSQLKAENNSEKLKNEIRQLFYSLYHSKKLTKTIYNNLINTI